MRKFDKILILFAIVMLFGSVTGCGNKAPEVTTTHHEYGSYTLIATEIYEECMANNDAQGAHDAIETMRYLSAFCCNGVHYDDVKNRNYNNINYNVGELQLAVAAYNENNDESAVDVEVDWICQFNSCTQEQHDAIDAYVEWFQTGSAYDIRKEYENRFYSAYHDIDITNRPSVRELTPEQFEEVQRYMADPSYQVDTTLWE